MTFLTLSFTIGCLYVAWLTGLIYISTFNIFVGLVFSLQSFVYWLYGSSYTHFMQGCTPSVSWFFYFKDFFVYWLYQSRYTHHMQGCHALLILIFLLKRFFCLLTVSVKIYTPYAGVPHPPCLVGWCQRPVLGEPSPWQYHLSGLQFAGHPPQQGPECSPAIKVCIYIFSTFYCNPTSRVLHGKLQ